jgi:hypothetical protein
MKLPGIFSRFFFGRHRWRQSRQYESNDHKDTQDLIRPQQSKASLIHNSHLLINKRNPKGIFLNYFNRFTGVDCMSRRCLQAFFSKGTSLFFH